MKIPLIDIGPLYSNDVKAKREVGQQIDDVCRKSGFFQISNHGIDSDLLKKLTSESFSFFRKLSTEQKMKLARRRFNPKNDNKYRGYFPATANGKEGFDVGNPDENHEIFKQNLPLHDLTPWPDMPGFRPFIQDYYRKMSDLAQVVLRGFAIGSGKEENFFDDKVKYEDCMSTLRLNYYPFLDDIEAVEISSDGIKLGCETHRDSSLITILFQPIEGLQVEDDESGWIDVMPSNQYFVIK
jgi:isopenicillin N synthase-like dioxygenase